MKEIRGFAVGEQALTSFDRQFSMRCRVQRPDRYRLLDALPADAPRIARGSGVSYVAASFGVDAVTQDMAAFDRLLAFDGDRGLLRVEAGARIGDVERFALAHGWYLPVAPGHPAATIGGCIAADVHGKNPARDGTFRAQVAALELWRDGGGVTVSPDHGGDLFADTCAGFGLTGTIVSATLRLARAPATLVVRRIPVESLAEAAQVLRDALNVPLLYGWHDGRPGTFGRGVIRIGLDTGDAAALPPSRLPDLPIAIAPSRIPTWNRLGIALANGMIRRRWCRPGQSAVTLADTLFPLNAARPYFAGFGRAGFVEAQWLVPHTRFVAFAAGLEETVARMRPRISLISSKLFAGEPDGLAFDGHGIALALHLPAPADGAQRAFLDALTELALAHGGRPNLIKDSTLDAATVRRALPGFETVRDRLRRWDPDGHVRSELTRRIGL